MTSSSGWRDSLANPADMLANLATAQPKADMAQEAERFEWIRNQQILTANVKKNGMSTIDRARFEKTAALLLPQARVDALAGIIESGFLPKAEDRAV